MSRTINLMIRDDGVATIYDDTYDITIHCENEEEQHKVVELLKSVPSAQPECKKAKWDFIGNQMFECTNCEVVYTQNEFKHMRPSVAYPEFPNFCPNCGADMRI